MSEIRELHDPLRALVSRIPPDDADAYAALRHLTLERLLVEPEARRWVFAFTASGLFQVLPFLRWEEKVRTVYEAHAGGPIHTEMHLSLALPEPPALEEVIGHYWPGFLHWLKVHEPQLLAMLDEKPPRLTDGRLVIGVRHDDALKFLNALHANARMETFWKRYGAGLILPPFTYVPELGREALDIIKTSIQEEAVAPFIDELMLEHPNDSRSNKDNAGSHNGTADGSVILGKAVTGETIPLSHIQDPTPRAVIAGRVFAKDVRELKNGGTLFMLKLTDDEDALGVKVFARSDVEKEALSKVAIGDWLKVRGSVQEDAFERENVMVAQDISRLIVPERTDTAPNKRVELHLHTTMSAMDAPLAPAAAVKRAHAYGHEAVAITDHGVAQAFPEAYEAGKTFGVKVIFGMEAYIVDDGVGMILLPRRGRRLETDTYVVFDVETTGLSQDTDTIIEIGAVKLKEGKIVDRFQSFAHYAEPLPAKIVALTGITDQMLKDAPPLPEVLQSFVAFVGEATLVAHNARFDIGFLNVSLDRAGLKPLHLPVIDTLEVARALLTELKNHRLDTLAKHFSVTLTQHHRADHDAEATGKIFTHMLRLLAERGLLTQDDLATFTGGDRHMRSRPFHATLLVKSEEGLKNLYRLITISHLETFYREPRILKSVLAEHRHGLLIGSACDEGEVFETALNKTEQDLERVMHFYDYIELLPPDIYEPLIHRGVAPDMEAIERAFKKIIATAKRLGKPVVATGNVHHLDPQDKIYREILLRAQNGMPARDPATLPSQHFRTTEEMLASFSFLERAVAEEIVIHNPCSIAREIPSLKPFPDGLFTPVIEGAEEEVRRLAENRARDIYGEVLPPLVAERLERELTSIIGNGFAVIYLIAQKLVKRSLDDGYLVGSRGSVGSSFVATMLGITEVNPLPPHYVCPSCHYTEFVQGGSVGSGFDLPEKTCPQCSAPLHRDGHDIPFETFMGFEGDKVPDIDLNFSGEYQPRAHKYTEELFGKGYVFRAGTISTVAEKTAFGFVRKYLEETGRTVRKVEMERLALGAAGAKRTTGQHPGGLMVVPQHLDVHDFTPIQRPADDPNSETTTTHFDYHAISGRLLKLDILGHDDPTVLRMLEDLSGIDPRSLPPTDPKVMRLFQGTDVLGENLGLEAIDVRTGTLGIPEFGTRFVRGMLEETRPKTFAELVQISGLSHGTDVWLGNAQEVIQSGQAELKDVIGCRDDIMVYLIYKGLPPKDAFRIMESVRKGKGLKPEDEALMRAHHVPEWYLTSCKKIKYMFPKAHAVAYVLMALRIAYFKVYRPLEFYATYFSVRADDFDLGLIGAGESAVLRAIREIHQKGNEATAKEKALMTVLEVAYEFYRRGFHFLSIDLYRSFADRFLIQDGALLPPFTALSGLGQAAAESIARAREQGPFLSIQDFAERTRVTRTMIESLRTLGVFGDLPEENQMSLFDFA
ncbi:MAG: PolC-type DNA polymerase III [Candidatus Carbobacillus altaicus]|nr:PolC-type DNA polymerase III [Candidatus Carbobacillus altaicus]